MVAGVVSPVEEEVNEAVKAIDRAPFLEES